MKNYISLIVACLFCVSVQGQKKVNRTYGDNLVTVSPFVGYASPQFSDFGVGVAYERFVNDYIGVKLPVNFGLSSNMFQTGLGFKFYPGGHKRPVKYAVGPTLLLTRSSGTTSVQRFDSLNNFWFTEEVDNPLMQFGFMLNNSLNITIQKNIYIGGEMGLGINYLNDFKNTPTNNNLFRNEEPNVMFMFTMSMGYRF